MDKEENKREVAASDQYDFEYWANHFNVSVEDLKAAINDVGDSTDKLATYFEKRMPN